jgi:hypothetical protein
MIDMKVIRTSSSHILQNFDLIEHLFLLIFGGEGDIDKDCLNNITMKYIQLIRG